MIRLGKREHTAWNAARAAAVLLKEEFRAERVERQTGT
jgi:hypothetical protein